MMGDLGPAVVATGLRKAFGAHVVLDNFTLELTVGSMVAVIGPSGCGKSTLLNIVGLLEGFDAGELRLFGTPAPKVGSRGAQHIVRSRINYLFQSFALVESETVEKNLMMALRYARVSRQKGRARIEDALKRVGLEGYLTRRVFELSGGEQQRVALARCIVKPGDLILADEPTGSLDAANRDVIVSLLRQMTEGGKTVLAVTHDPTVWQARDRAIRLRAGPTPTDNREPRRASCWTAGPRARYALSSRRATTRASSRMASDKRAAPTVTARASKASSCVVRTMSRERSRESASTTTAARITRFALEGTFAQRAPCTPRNSARTLSTRAMGPVGSGSAGRMTTAPNRRLTSPKAKITRQVIFRFLESWGIALSSSLRDVISTSLTEDPRHAS